MTPRRTFLTCLLLGFASLAAATECERLSIRFDAVESDRKLRAADVTTETLALAKRGAPGPVRFLAGGDFTLAPYTAEQFTVREDDRDLALSLAWRPLPEGSVKRFEVHYRATLSCPFQPSFAELENTVELDPGDFFVITEAAAPQGTRDTRPVHVILAAEEHRPSFAFKNLGGIGAQIDIKSGYPYIKDLVSGGPAALAGLHAGDEIRMIDGYATLGTTIHAAARLIRGDPGTPVRLTVRRAGAAIYEDITLTRQLSH